MNFYCNGNKPSSPGQVGAHCNKMVKQVLNEQSLWDGTYQPWCTTTKMIETLNEFSEWDSFSEVWCDIVIRNFGYEVWNIVYDAQYTNPKKATAAADAALKQFEKLMGKK